MRHTLYIDHPDHHSAYTYTIGEMTCNEFVSRKLGVNAQFVCNALAQIGTGDIYKIVFDTPEDVTAFILRSEYPLVDSSKIQEYYEQMKKPL